ncbi:MAG: hypothetical protein AAGU11_08490 [Syntrophobacteraceae bacterium]
MKSRSYGIFVSVIIFVMCCALFQSHYVKSANSQTVLIESISNTGNNCSNVVSIEEGPIVTGIENTILDAYYEAGSIEPIKIQDFRTINALAEWLVVEAEVVNMEPAIFLIKRKDGAYIIVDIFAGTPDFSETISKYFMGNNSDVPFELLKCFAPKGPPFDIPLNKQAGD